MIEADLALPDGAGTTAARRGALVATKVALHRPSAALSSVDHALRLIQVLRDTGELRVSEAAVELGVSASTAHRLLAMLVYRGFAVQRDSRAYAPGAALGARPVQNPWTRQLRDICLPHLRELTAEVDATSHLLIRTGSNVRFLASAEAPNALRVPDRAGIVLSAKDTSGGKIMLADLDDSQINWLYRSASARERGDYLSDSEYADLRRELIRVRLARHAINPGISEPGIFALGAGVPGATGRAIAAVAVSIPASRASALSDPRLLEIVHGACSRMSADLAKRGAAEPSHGVPESA